MRHSSEVNESYITKLCQWPEFYHMYHSLKFLLDEDNLAAVLIHLNDTYDIEAAPESNMPGMERIAGFIGLTRDIVMDHLGEDRTLVFHGGDFLAPSLMSNKFKGRQMIDLLNFCPVTYATIGNHEFDFGLKNLIEQLTVASFKPILANLVPPQDTAIKFQKVAFWPPNAPFLAVTALAGEQTRKKAESCGFTAVEMGTALENIDHEVESKDGIVAVIVLTHMRRAEDLHLMKDLQFHLSGRAVYLLGGHDHYMNWTEKRYGSRLFKCLSNGRSFWVCLVPKDAITAKVLKEVLIPDGYIEKHWAKKLLSHETVTPVNKTLEDVIRIYRQRMGDRLPQDFIESFERKIREEFANWTQARIDDAIRYGSLASYLLDVPRRHWSKAFDAFVFQMHAPAMLQAFPVHERAQAMVNQYAEQMKEGTELNSAEVIMDFSDTHDADLLGLDATDEALRARSTDFGNFIADSLAAGSGADVAIINAGAFRIDQKLPPRITVGTLMRAFLFDGLDGIKITVVELRGDMIKRIVDHGITRRNQGGFIQVSRNTVDATRQLTKRFKVALSNFMLFSPEDEDGFREALSSSDKLSESDLRAGLKDFILQEGSINTYIRRGAAQILYSAEARLPADVIISVVEKDARRFIELADEYEKACEDKEIPRNHRVFRSSDNFEDDSDAIRKSRDGMFNFVENGVINTPNGGWFQEVLDWLTDTELPYLGETWVPYHRYFENVYHGLLPRKYFPKSKHRVLGGDDCHLWTEEVNEDKQKHSGSE